MTEKADIRKEILLKRNNLDAKFQTEASQNICERLLNLAEFKNAENIAFYIANKGEVDPFYLLPPSVASRQLPPQAGGANGEGVAAESSHSQAGVTKKYYLPILDPEKPNHLLFQSYNPNEMLTPNRYGIPEPKLDPKKLINPRDLDCVLTPLVGFDKKGNRLGMGVGYYDRSFSFLQNKKRPGKPILIGLAYSFQEISVWRPDNWDIALDIVITEKEALRVQGK